MRHEGYGKQGDAANAVFLANKPIKNGVLFIHLERSEGSDAIPA